MMESKILLEDGSSVTVREIKVFLILTIIYINFVIGLIKRGIVSNVEELNMFGRFNIGD